MQHPETVRVSAPDLPGGYKVVNKDDLRPEDKLYKEPKVVKGEALLALIGSSVLPAEVEISAGVTAQLGTVVAAAHAASGFSVEEWNKLAEAKREEMIANQLAVMQAESIAK